MDPDPIKETVGRNRLLEATKDLTGAALATRLGSTQSFIFRVLKGTRLPGRALAARIAEEFPGIPATTWDQEPKEVGSTEPADPPAAHAKTGTENA